MEDKKILSSEELEKVTGGVELSYDGDWIVFDFEPNESVRTFMQGGFGSTHDAHGLLDKAANALDAPDRIHTARTLKVKIGNEPYLKPGFTFSVVDVQY